MDNKDGKSHPLEEYLDLEFNKVLENHDTSLMLVGKAISNKSINFKAIQSVLTTTWNLGPNVRISQMDNNVFSSAFKNARDRDKVEQTRPWIVKGATICLKE